MFDLLSNAKSTRSPAVSWVVPTKLSFPLVTAPVMRLSDVTTIWSIMWERDECSFMSVFVQDLHHHHAVMRDKPAAKRTEEG
jgi:hypothetical protein